MALRTANWIKRGLKGMLGIPFLRDLYEDLLSLRNDVDSVNEGAYIHRVYNTGDYALAPNAVVSFGTTVSSKNITETSASQSTVTKAGTYKISWIIQIAANEA